MIIKLIWKMLLDTKRVEFQVRYYINFDFKQEHSRNFSFFVMSIFSGLNVIIDQIIVSVVVHVDEDLHLLV